MESKRIGTFKQFLKEQRRKKINEANVSIECEWWDQCILEVMQEIEDECQVSFSWDTIIKYCKDKWAILGRPIPQPESDDSILLQEHLKDLIFQFHGKSFYVDWNYGASWDNSQIHSKGIVIEELSSVILDKIREKTMPQKGTPANNVTGTLSDREEVTLVPMKPIYTNDCEDEYYEDLPIEYESKRVYDFRKYSKMIEEAKDQFKLVNDKKIIDHILKRLESEAGSLKLDDVVQMIYNKKGYVNPNDFNAENVDNYIKGIALEYLKKDGAVQTIVRKNKDTFISRNVADGIYNLFAEMVVCDVRHILTNPEEEGREDEEAE